MDKNQKFIDHVKSKYDPGVFAYLGNKRQGGDSGKKGSRYEDNFATYLMSTYIEKFFAVRSESWPSVHDQIVGFVDDLHIESEDELLFFQCKNSKSVSWTSGKHTIAEDFSLQNQIWSELGEKSITTTLVVSCQNLMRLLSSAIPDEIKPHSDVMWFPCLDGRHSALVQTLPDLQRALSSFSRVSNPPLDEMVATFSMLSIAFAQKNPESSIWDIFCRAQDLNPSFMALTSEQLKRVRPNTEFESILAKIEGLTYNFKRGFFAWEWGNTSGIYPHNCLSTDFFSFQTRIIKFKPRDFDELEAHLI